MPNRRPDIGFLPTPPEVVDVILDLAGLNQQDLVYDLGCGDGRILIAAAQRFGVRGVGIDIDHDRVQEATHYAQQAGVSHLLTFQQQDLYESQFASATVVILYLLPHLNLKLRPRIFDQLKPGTRIISHDFDMGDWPPEQIVQIPTQEGEVATLYYWTLADAIAEIKA
ncbi:MAG: class I SAM-dependent methyltransferase [Oscillatoriales cyanobacterium C42_A2020_001]|nr:class I SAM-dependent methyltransferase [Leptolyngbyaceae cyanobacterium C42_A2020_001]